ncbi:citrate lyase acyl carrier protein [Vibrio cholerae]|nr:citrate lyase acyl carrier protein [Vibrio cholerae]EJL6669490.1 citrate lyase acyl carrier protein [Vibrio cholerae]
MKIAHPAFAGTLESSDLQVRIEPNNDGGIELVLDSTVEQQFGHAIRQVVLHTLDAMQVRDALVTIEDKGALDCVIRARVQAAVMRACDVQQIEWSQLS